MARLLYACRFDVSSPRSISDVLDAYQNWIVDHYRTHRKLSIFELDLMSPDVNAQVPEGHILSVDPYIDGSERVVRIRWSFPDDTDKGLRWANEIRVGQFGPRCGVEHLISMESVEYRVAPARPLFGSPRVVRDICTSGPTYIGEMQVVAEPYRLKVGDLNDLVNLLTSEHRTLPVVVLSPYARGEQNQIEPSKLAKNLAGVAVVVEVTDTELTWDFADEVGRQLSCFNGAARIYWPGFSTDADSRNHRLYLGSWIERTGASFAARAIERAIFAVAAFRYVHDDRIADLIRRFDAAERQRLLTEKKATGDDFWAEYERDLDRLEQAELKIEALQSENANLRANQQVLFASGNIGAEDLPEIDQSPDEEPNFSTVAEALAGAVQRCQNLVVLNSALSAAKDSPFLRPYDVFKALLDLDEIVVDWDRKRKEQGNGGDLLQHLRDRGWGKRSSMHISDTTRSKYRSHYEFEYQGAKQLFEPHITIGAGDPNSCASIHFVFDQERLKMVIGHVGKHLPNTRT